MNQLEKHLVEEVRNYENLYVTTLKTYKDANVTQNSWTEISKTVGLSVPECIKKWRTLRDKFVRIRRKMTSRRGEAGVHQRDPAFYNSLSWLAPHVRHRETLSSDDVKANGTDLPPVEPQEGDVIARPVVSPRLSSPPVDITFTVPSADDWGSSGSSLPSSPVLTGEKRKRKRHGTPEDLDLDAGLSVRDKRRAQRADGGDYFDRYVLHIADFMRTLPPEQCCVFKFQLQKLMFETEQSVLANRRRGDNGECSELWDQSAVKVQVSS